MLNIIKSDCYRILKGKAIYIVFLVFTLSFFLVSLVMSPGHVGVTTSDNGNINMSDPEFLEELSQAKSLKDVRRIMKSNGEFELDRSEIGANANLYYGFIVIVVIVLCTDFSNKSIKNTLSSAITRKKYYLAKTLFIFGLCTVLMLFNNYGFYLVNYLINGKGFSSSLLEVTKLTLIQLPLIYGIISVLIGIAFVLKKTSTFNTLAISLIMIVQLVGVSIINLFHLKGNWFYDYEFQFALSKLVTNPGSEYTIKCALLGICYMVVFHTIGYYAFQKSEIK